MEDEEEAGDEFSEDEFDPVEFDYENIRRPSPEGAEDKPGSGGGGHQPLLHDYYDLAELNESAEDAVEAASECGRINIINNSSYSSNSSPGSTTRDSDTRQGATMVPNT